MVTPYEIMHERRCMYQAVQVVEKIMMRNTENVKLPVLLFLVVQQGNISYHCSKRRIARLDVFQRDVVDKKKVCSHWLGLVPGCLTIDFEQSPAMFP